MTTTKAQPAITIAGKTFHPSNEDERVALEAAHARYHEAVSTIDTFAPMIWIDAEDDDDAQNQIAELVREENTEVPAAAEAKGIHHYSDRLMTAVTDALYERADACKPA